MSLISGWVRKRERAKGKKKKRKRCKNPTLSFSFETAQSHCPPSLVYLGLVLLEDVGRGLSGVERTLLALGIESDDRHEGCDDRAWRMGIKFIN